jgi:hypothetical protein
MSVQYGVWNQDGRTVDADHVERAKTLLAPYGPDGCGSYQRANISILYHAFHITKESRHESQPHTTRSGDVITWDGLLDNGAELCWGSTVGLLVFTPNQKTVHGPFFDPAVLADSFRRISWTWEADRPCASSV